MNKTDETPDATVRNERVRVLLWLLVALAGIYFMKSAIILLIAVYQDGLAIITPESLGGIPVDSLHDLGYRAVILGAVVFGLGAGHLTMRLRNRMIAKKELTAQELEYTTINNERIEEIHHES